MKRAQFVGRISCICKSAVCGSNLALDVGRDALKVSADLGGISITKMRRIISYTPPGQHPLLKKIHLPQPTQ
jgi:hypothetical protein